MNKVVLVWISSLLLTGCAFLSQTETTDTSVDQSGAVTINQEVPTNYSKVKAYPYTCENGTKISVSEVDDYLYVFVDTFAESFEYLPETNESGDLIYVYENSPVYSTLEFAGEGAYMYTFLDDSTMCFSDDA